MYDFWSDMIDQLFRRQVFKSPIKMPWRVGIGPELGRCLSQRVGSGTIPQRYGILIPAAEDVGSRNLTCDGGLLNVGIY